MGAGLTAAAPASAGGVGDFLSPAFGVNCANHHLGTQAAGARTAGTGAANGNLLGLPLGGALNQCGGADLPDANASVANQEADIAPDSQLQDSIQTSNGI
ncbi:hypothetical protein LUR56_40820 [Streptomyces sp. MT29]|nr:hypothetical protein [Streptomyces sp. MT29]